MLSQLEVFPRRVVDFMPFSRKGHAHAFCRAIVEGGDVYIAKGVDKPLVCATEWIVAYLAQGLRLDVPEHVVLQMPDGALVFGSKEVTHRLNGLETSQLLFSPTPPNNVTCPDLPETCSALFALDMAVGNPDRHLDNYLFSADSGPQAPRRTAYLRPIDFDQADILSLEATFQSLADSTFTVLNARQIGASRGFRPDVATDLLIRLEKGRETMVRNALHGMPTDWLPENGRQGLMDRIASPSFAARLAQAKQGLSSGTYL